MRLYAAPTTRPDGLQLRSDARSPPGTSSRASTSLTCTTYKHLQRAGRRRPRQGLRHRVRGYPARRRQVLRRHRRHLQRRRERLRPSTWPTAPTAPSCRIHRHGVEAKDDKTVTFTLKYPFDSLLQGRLSRRSRSSRASHEHRGPGPKTPPIGTGPWVYDDHQRRRRWRPSSSRRNDELQRPVPRCRRHHALGHPARRHRPHHRRCRRPRPWSWRTCPTPTPSMLTAAGLRPSTTSPGFNQPFFMFNTPQGPVRRQARPPGLLLRRRRRTSCISNAMAGHAAKPSTGFLPESPRQLPRGVHRLHLRPREGQVACLPRPAGTDHQHRPC